IVGRVQKTFRGKDNYTNAYKLKIRNVFKSTPKATVALKSGRILTPAEESMCGITLRPRETYVHVTRRRTKSPNTCVTNNDECYERHGICLHDRERRCRWTR
ncbi:putative metalloproteinase inhibitor 3, partial [Operophtera brumata]